MISEKILRKWRKEALEKVHPINSTEEAFDAARDKNQANQRIFKMTQELLDQHLMRK